MYDLVAEALLVELNCVTNRMRCIVESLKVTRRCIASCVCSKEVVQWRKASKAIGMVNFPEYPLFQCDQVLAHPWSVVYIARIP